MTKKQQIITALRAFVAQRNGMDWRNYGDVTSYRAEALAGIERDVKRLQDALDVEAALLKDRQRIIDLYEGQGFLTFKEGSDARIAAQDDFTERLRANMAEEEAILKRGLATVAKTTQEKARLTARLEDVMARRARLEREVQMSGLERSIREPGEAFKTTLADIEQRSKALQTLADDEAAIMRSRQRVIDLYQERGYLRFREATDLRANAQQEYLERSRAYFDQEEALLRTALETVAKTADQRRQIEERLAALAAKRQRMEREAAQVTLERAIRSPFEALRDIQERASRAESEFKTREEQIRLLRESGAISELESLRRLATAREESARQLEQLAAEARAVAESAPGNERFAESMRQIAESARTAADGAVAVDYCVGWGFPTEYRKAVCAVCASVLWAYMRVNYGAGFAQSAGRPVTGSELRAQFRREYGRGIASRWFN